MPIALTILLPIFAIGALWAIRRGARYRHAWGISVGMLALLLASGWVALQTGETEEDRVKRFVREAAIESHEEAAEQFMVAAGIILLLAGAGLIPGRTGAIARTVATVGTVALVGAAYNVGRSGGALVYHEGAAMAYIQSAADASVQKAQFFADFVEAENSMGFHAPRKRRGSSHAPSTTRVRANWRCAEQRGTERPLRSRMLV